MNVALYARVSSEKQAENDLSISAQLKALRSYAEKNGWTVYKEFVDEAESALSANRPAFQEMIGAAKKKIHHLKLSLYGNSHASHATEKIQLSINHCSENTVSPSSQ